MTKVSFLKRIIPVVVVASLASVALLAGCSCSPTDDTAKDDAVVEEESVTVVPENTTYISKDEAKSIALEYENLLETDAKNMQVTENVMDGVKVYEVTFEVDDVKYEYVIDATTGDILEYVSGVGTSNGSGGTSGNANNGSSSGNSSSGSNGSNGSNGGSGSASDSTSN